MAWLTLDNLNVALFGNAGAEALRGVMDELAPLVQDGVLDQDDIRDARTRLGRWISDHPDVANTLLLTVIEKAGGERETIEWLIQPAKTTGDIRTLSKREQRWSLVDWARESTPDSDVTASFGLDASAGVFLSIRPPADEKPGLLYCAIAGLDGSISAKAALDAAALLDQADTISVQTEASRRKEIRYEVDLATPEVMTGRALVKALRGAAHSPVSLKALSSAFDKGLSRVVLHDQAGRRLEAKTTVSAPIITSQVLIGGKLSLSATIKVNQDALNSTTLTKRTDGLIELKFERTHQHDNSRSVDLGIELEFAASELLLSIIEATDHLDRKVKDSLTELANAGDLRDDIKNAIRGPLETYFGDVMGEAIADGLFDEAGGDAFSGFLADQLETRILQTATPWLTNSQDLIRDEVVAWLAATGLADKKLSETSIRELATKTLDDAFQHLNDRFDEKIETLAGRLKGETDEVGALLNQLGESLVDNTLVNQAEMLAQKLKDVLERLVGRVGKIKSALEAASALTLSAQFVAETHRREQHAATATLSFDPASNAAQEMFRAAVLAPASTSNALASVTALPDGVSMDQHNEAVRIRRAARRAFTLKLSGLTIGTEQMLSSDTQVVRVGNQVLLMSAQQARAWRRGFWDEDQILTATYLLSDAPGGEEAANGLLEDEGESWVDGAVSVTSEIDSPLIFTIHHSDTRNFRAGEVASLLDNFIRTGLLKPAFCRDVESYCDALRYDHDGRLNAAIEVNLKLSTAQLNACLHARNNGVDLRAHYSRSTWQALSDMDKKRLDDEFTMHIAGYVRGSNPSQTFHECLELSDRELAMRHRRARHGNRGLDERKMEALWKTLRLHKHAANAFSELLGALSEVTNRSLDIATRQARLREINELLSTWTRPAGQILFSEREEVDELALAFILAIRNLCGAENMPDIFLSIEDKKTGGVRHMSDLLATKSD